MIAFLVFLVVLFLVAVLAVTLPYWYERGNSPCEDIPSAAYGPKPVLKLWFEAALAALQLGVAFPLDPIMRHCENADEHEDTADYPPVLLVHGLYHNPSGWLYMRKALRKAGFRKIHTMSYSSCKNASVDAVTALLESSVQSLENRYEGRKPVLVGHSLGGLVIRNWLATAENQNRAFGAVTLGAPHRGSKMAALACGALGKSLCPTNPFFEDLARKEKEASIPCVSLVSEADTMVLPQQNLVPVTKGWTMRVTPYATHAGIMTKSAVCRMVAWELHRMVADAPKPAAKPAPKAEKPAAAPAPVKTETKAPEAAKPAEKPVEKAAEKTVAAPAPKPETKPAAKAAPKATSKKTPAKSGKSAPKAAKKPAKK